MSKSLYQIEGFEQLNAKIKKLPDKVKRTELLKILGQVANPTLKAAQSLAPRGSATHTRYTGTSKGVRRKRNTVSQSNKTTYQPGNLKESIRKIILKRGPAKVNAMLHVGAKVAKRKKGRYDGYYAHMVVKKGFTGRKRAGSTNDFIKKAYNQTKGKVTAESEKKVSKYIQKQIDKLSEKGI